MSLDRYHGPVNRPHSGLCAGVRAGASRARPVCGIRDGWRCRVNGRPRQSERPTLPPAQPGSSFLRPSGHGDDADASPEVCRSAPGRSLRLRRAGGARGGGRLWARRGAHRRPGQAPQHDRAVGGRALVRHRDEHRAGGPARRPFFPQLSSERVARSRRRGPPQPRLSLHAGAQHPRRSAAAQPGAGRRRDRERQPASGRSVRGGPDRPHLRQVQPGLGAAGPLPGVPARRRGRGAGPPRVGQPLLRPWHRLLPELPAERQGDRRGGGGRRLPLLLQPALELAHRSARLPVPLLVQARQRPHRPVERRAEALSRRRRALRRRPLLPLLIMRTFVAALLIGGAATAQQFAPVPDPDAVRIHVLEQRPFTEAGRWELTFFGSTQVNPKFTMHAGLSAEVAYHLRENLAAQVGLWYFPVSVQSTLSEELLNKARVAPESAEALLIRGAALAGLELMPIYGKLNVFDGKILRLGIYPHARAGGAKTRLQLRPSTDPGTGRTFGDTGYRPIASLGLGLRVFLRERGTSRLELRDFAYSGYVSRGNGCNHGDGGKIAAPEGGGRK